MPAKTERQRKFMGTELARKRAGKKTKTKMSEKQLKHFAHKAQEGIAVSARDLIKTGWEE